jgi:acetyltransferase
LISQSGAICTAILDWAEARHISFSALVSLGAAADTGFGDLLDFFAQDEATDSILLYIEGIRHARKFIDGLRRAASLKPVIVLKAGRHAAGSLAATTHTGALVGGDAVFDAVLRRSGVVRVRSIEQLFAAAQLLSSRCLIEGRRLAILTNGGGLGVMAVDRAMDLGIELAILSADSITQLNACMPPYWSHANPVDILGDASAERYASALQAILPDHGVDGVLVMLSPQAMTDIEGCARVVADVAAASDKPVLACWMGGAHMGVARAGFTAAGVPHFDSPETAVEAFAFLATHCHNQRLLQQTPAPIDDPYTADVATARMIVAKARAQGRNLLDMLESKALLRVFNIPVSPSVLCRSSEEALLAADSVGYPVVLKIHSGEISHKSDVGGVRLNIKDAQMLTSIYSEMLASVQRLQPSAVVEGVVVEPMHHSKHGRELMVGMVCDPVFGPALSFGAGGTQVEVLQDCAIALPLDSMLIEDMISKTRVAKLLGTFRGMPAIDRLALHQVMQAVSRMVCELPELASLDINPLVADENGVIALDARIELVTRANTNDSHL